MLFKNMIRQITHSLGRFLAIFAIVALGVGFFVGLRVSKDAMVKTGSDYFEELKLFDFRLVSTLGLTDADVAAISEVSEVEYAVGSVSADMMVVQPNGANGVLHMHSILEGMNLLDLQEGRMPESADECVIDGKYYSAGMLGEYIELSKDNSESTFDTFAYDRYKVVGVARSPYYANFERGSSSLGGVSGFCYILPEGFSTEYYTEIFLRMKERYEIYSEKCEEYTDKCEALIKPVLEDRGNVRYEALRTEALEKIHEAEEELAAGKKELEEKRAEVDKQIADGEKKLTIGEQVIAKAEGDIEAGAARLEEVKAQLDEARVQFELAKSQFDAMKNGANKAVTGSVLAQQQQVLAEMEQKISEYELAVATSEQQMSAALEELAKNKGDIEAGRKELAEGRIKADKEFADAEAEIADAQKKIDEAYEKVEEIKEPSVFVLGRSTNIGYVSLGNDTDIVAGVAQVFPFFFFIVASLVCITTMTRMVDEQRVQNGVLKALGYSDFAIVGQYLFYAGTASVMGCIVGFLVGSKFMPLVLWEIYHIMYSINRPIVYLLDWKLFAFCAILYLVATLGTTWMAASGDLREAAAELIRPKAPVAGKRVFLERINFIWKRLKFLHKVSIRNILRYKKRMFMMIVGVGGCTALLLTGYGIKDSIQPILDYQFGEIHVYDMAVSFMNPVDDSAQQQFEQENKNVLGDIAFVRAESMDLMTNGSSDSVTMVVADELKNNIVSLHNGDKEYSWPGLNETIIDYRLADANDISIGDTIEFRNSDFEVLKLKVVGIFDNYIRDFAYISSETYKAQMGRQVEKNTAYLNLADGVEAVDAETQLLSDDNVTSVSVTARQAANVGNMLSSLDLVVLLVLVCAGALAFIVIYNLTNISINERIREIATIKVLGFHEGEAAAYVFRENLVLTLISSIVGLPMGVALHRYVMAQIKISSMYFGHRILPMSFVWSVVITFLFAVVVDVFMYFRLKKINMAESLKAVD